MMGDTSAKVCETNVELNKVGIVLTGGLNPVAAAAEAGIECDNHSMSTTLEFGELTDYRKLLS